MAASRWIVIGLLIFAAVAGAGFALQRREAEAMGAEIALLRGENRQLLRLREENRNLQAQALPEDELQRLRADHVALLRLRGEMEVMTARAEKISREVGGAPNDAGESKGANPTLRLRMAITSDGGLLIDGSPVELEALRQRFAMAKGLVELRLRAQETEASAGVRKRAIERLKNLARDAGVPCEIIFEQ